MPHQQAPEAQVSAVAPQVTHATPLSPQVAALGIWQAPWAQQPVGHEVASQMHAPPTHRRPAPHGAEAPQAQPPFVQRSAAVVLHAMQALPFVPHVKAVGLAHTPNWQQPEGQLVASQTQAPDTHRWPAAQAAPAPHRQAPPTHESAPAPQVVQLAPLVPQAIRLDVWHAPLRQQPEGQLVASQTHWPPTQRWPAPHAAPAPHRHAPAVQRSAPAPQLAQVAPLIPQAAMLGLWQAPFEQHPEGQLVASHTH